MTRKIIAIAVVVAGLLVGSAATAGAATPIPLVLPQGDAFAVLGHSCGGIQEQAYATGFDPTTGYPTGDVHLSTRCGGSGRGGGYHTTTYTAWTAVTWDFSATVTTYSPLASPPTVDPGFSAFDAHGNEVYNSSGSAFLVLADGFVPAPRVTGISPATGPASGGTTVTITGTGFTGATGVSFGGVAAASFTIASDTQITAVSPSRPGGTFDVTVANAGGSSTPVAADVFTAISAPTISGLSPATGPVTGGTQVTITGTGFSSATSVTFGDTAVGFTVDSDTQITAWSPASDAGADTVAVVVTTTGGSATSPRPFSYVAATFAISPRSGPAGTALVARGKGFAPGEVVIVAYATGVTASPYAVVCVAVVNATTAFACGGSVPTAGAGPIGAHAVLALALTSNIEKSTTFTLTS